MFNILQDLFTNATIMIAFITFGNHFFKEEGIGPTSAFHRKAIIGIASGILGCMLMLNSVEVIPKVLVDFRSIPVITMAIYASFSSAVIASMVIGIFRIIYYGFSQASFTAFVAVLVVGVGSGLIGTLNINRPIKWALSVGLSCLAGSIAFITLMYNSSLLIDILISYITGTSLVSIAMYHFIEYIDKSNEVYRQMKKDAKNDFLTGLNNVRQFDVLLNTALKNSKEKNEKLSILFIDIDFFKKINDDYGHSAGDKILKELGEILIQVCRSLDIVSRNGGEEFSVISLDCSLPQAITLAERIRKAVEQHGFVINPGKKIHITVSVGVSSYPDTVDDPDRLVEQSDIALYKAKRAGRNRIEIA